MFGPCETCCCYVADKRICRRHAPQPVVVGGPPVTQWPQVDGNGCGEHQPSMHAFGEPLELKRPTITHLDFNQCKPTDSSDEAPTSTETTQDAPTSIDQSVDQQSALGGGTGDDSEGTLEGGES